MRLPVAVSPEAPRASGSFVFVFLALAWLGAGCGGAKAVTTPPPHLEPQLAPAAPLPKSRWIDGSGATLVGPALAGGTLVLVGGRRALVDRASVTRLEEAPSPEPLEEVTLAPTLKGPLLLGRGRDTLYVFETPLGPARALAQTEGAFTRIGAGPGYVAAWTTLADLPVILDLATGLPAAATGSSVRLPELPARAVAFLDERRGAAVFEAAGLAVTSDGGATFRLADDGGRGDALRVSGLRLRGDALRAFVYADGPDAAIDPVSGRLGVAEPIEPAAGEADLVRWVRLTGRDPLEAAASGGVEARDGSAIAASHGLLAQVDLVTGGLLELAEFARGKWVSPCSVARAGGGAGAAWIACAVSEDTSRDALFDPFGVFRVPLGRPRIEAERLSLVRNGEAELVVSPSGGAMLLGPCSADDEAEVCVRRPDGAWSSMRVEVDLGGRGAGPLADGRIAFLRGLVEGDQEREQEREQARDLGAGPPASAAGSTDEEAPRTRRVHLAITGGADREEALPPFDVPAPSGEVRVLGAVEEEADHSLRLVVDGGGGPEVVIQPRGRAEATVTRVPFAAAARLRGGRGVAVGDGRIFASLDAGSSWGEIAAPPFALASARAITASPDGWTRIEVSDAGVKLGSALRLGWGAPEAAPTPAPEGRAPRVEVKLPAPLGPERQLTCVSDGAGTGAVPLLVGVEVKARLEGKPPRPGTRRESSSFAGGRAGMLDTVALLEEEGQASPSATPSTWRLAWFDPTEIGGAPRAVTLPPYVPTKALGGASSEGASDASDAKRAGKPRGASEGRGLSWGASLRSATAAGERALFSLRVGGKSVLVRASGDGKGARVLAAEVAPELAPSSEVVFGVDRGEPIAWMHDATLIVWLAGEAPRAIASIATRAARSLGQPTRDGVPVLLSASDWAMLRVAPIPPLDPKGSAAKAQARSSLDGWKRAISIPRAPFALPACGGAVKGARFVVLRASLTAEVDGAREIGASALYDVRVAGESACVAGVSALVAPDLRADRDARGAPASRSAPSAHRERGGAAARGPVAFVRADLIARRAEGGERGARAATVRRLRCVLEAAR